MTAGSAVNPQIAVVGPLPQGRIADVKQVAGVPKGKPLGLLSYSAVVSLNFNHDDWLEDALPVQFNQKTYKNLEETEHSAAHLTQVSIRVSHSQSLVEKGSEKQRIRA